MIKHPLYHINQKKKDFQREEQPTMTINEYLQRVSKARMKPTEAGIPDISEALKDNTDIWSGDAALGYAAQAAIAAGMSEAQVERLLDAMSAAMEATTVDEAESYYVSGEYRGEHRQ